MDVLSLTLVLATIFGWCVLATGTRCEPDEGASFTWSA